MLIKIWIDQGSEFYNTHFKIGLKNEGNERKSVIAERFTRTLENKSYKHTKAASKNIYFNVLDDIVDENNNIYQIPIKASRF